MKSNDAATSRVDQGDLVGVSGRHGEISTDDVDKYSRCISETLGAFTVCKQSSRGRLGFTGRLNVVLGMSAFDILYDGAQAITPDHAHDGHAIVIGLSGSILLKEGARSYTLTEQQATVVCSPNVERVQVDEHSRHLGLHVATQVLNERLARLIERPVKQPLVFDVQREVRPEAASIMTGLVQTLTAPQLPGAAGEAQGLADNLQTATVDLFLRSTFHNYTGALSKPPALIAPRYVKRALEYMDANLTRAVNQDDLAEAAGVGVRALQYGFRRFVGVSPVEHLRALRLAGAKRDLERDRISSVAEIAAKWRFSNPGRFAAMFSTVYGVQPAEYRDRGRVLGA